MRYRWLMLAAVAVLSTGALNSERAGALTCGLTASQAVPIAPGGCHCPTGCQARIVALQLARSISEMPSFVGNSDGLAVALNASARDKKRPIAFSTEDVEKTLSTARLIRDDQHFARCVQEAIDGCGKYQGGDCRRASRFGASARRRSSSWRRSSVGYRDRPGCGGAWHHSIDARQPAAAWRSLANPDALVSLPCTS
jgi:hypothetical protein